METLIAIILGLVEGITEFLPISSPGHMILVDHLLGFNELVGKEVANAFEIVIQLGAILAIVAAYPGPVREAPAIEAEPVLLRAAGDRPAVHHHGSGWLAGVRHPGLHQRTPVWSHNRRGGLGCWRRLDIAGRALAAAAEDRRH